jgi:hypothetical protein
MNNLYGNGFIEKQRSSGYKSTIYAMSEIVDNSVDAKASEINIVLMEKEKYSGSRKKIVIEDIYFFDDGNGMDLNKLNKSLTFSEGEGKSDGRIGAFGVGLPNSSISVGRKVEVYSRTKGSKEWNYVFLDLDDQATRTEPGFDIAKQKSPEFDKLIQDIADKSNTIVRWSKLDLIDASKALTIIDRGNKLIGRIYRYKINKGLKIYFSSFLEGNAKFDHEPTPIIPYDPLYLMEKKNYMTEMIWRAATIQDTKGKHVTLGHLPEFTSLFHYKKFIEGCKKNETNKPLFQKHDDFWDVIQETKLCGKTYKWKIRAAFACKSITNPGIMAGGNTDIGRELGKKMSGDRNFQSGNIFFLRGEREIDFGNFGLYATTDEKNRFWTIEIHFDSDLDELMGVSNVKQSVDFKVVANSDLEEVEINEEIAIGLQREILWAQMTERITRCIKEMRSSVKNYAKEFQDYESSMLANEEGENESPIPQAESAVFEVIPKGEPWTEEQKLEIGKFLKSKYLHLTQEVINDQVEIFAKGLTRTIVLYSPNERGNLFEITEKQGKLITLINTNHVYYSNIIEKVKSNKHLKEFAIAIELLISSFALEMDRLILDNEEKYKQPLDKLLLLLSSRLSEFITDSNIVVNPEEWERLISEGLKKKTQKEEE